LILLLILNNNQLATKGQKSAKQSLEKDNLANWENLYQDFEKENEQDNNFSFVSNLETQSSIEDTSNTENVFHFKNKYILTPVKSGLMIIDQKKAHERILFEKFLQSLQTDAAVTQKTLFPKTIELDAKDHQLLLNLKDEMTALGFDIDDFGGNAIIINGMPADASNQEPEQIIDKFLNEYLSGETDVKQQAKEAIAKALAKASAISSNQPLTTQEMREIIDMLFACQQPNYSPFGKKIVTIIQTEEIDKRF